MDKLQAWWNSIKDSEVNPVTLRIKNDDLRREFEDEQVANVHK